MKTQIRNLWLLATMLTWPVAVQAQSSKFAAMYSLRRILLAGLFVVLGFTQMTESVNAQGLYLTAQQFTNVVIQTFSTDPLLYSITYQTRFVLVDKNCHIQPGSASQWITSSDIADEQNKNSFLLFKDKLVVSAISLSDLAAITAPFEPYGFSFGDVWDYHQVGSSSDYYKEVLPGSSDTLTVKSANPNSGVLITVTPVDANGNGNGTTTFTRTYGNNPSVTLTAPATAGGNSFSKWQLDGADWSTSLTTSVFMNQSHTITAVYNMFTNSIGPGLGIGCQLPGYSTPHLVYQYRNVRVDTNNHTVTYDTRSALISPNFNVANELIPGWQTDLVIDASVEPELILLYNWLNEKTVISFGDNSQGMSQMADYEANCFLWGDYEQANLSGMVYHYYQVVTNTECLGQDRLADFQPNGMISVGRFRSQAMERITNATPSEMFPALEVSFHWDQDAQHAGPTVDLLCASYEVNSFVGGSQSSCPSNAWSVPTWIVTKGADLRTPYATVDCNITPSMLGLSSEFYVTNDIVPTLTPLKLVSIEHFPGHHHPFTRYTYETDLALSFKLLAPAVFPGEPRFYTFGAGHKCRLIYEYAFDPIFANDGEWFLNTITGGATNEQLCLNPLERAYGSLLDFNKCLSRFKVVDAQGFVNWGILDSSNAVPQEATNALQRLNNIFAQFPLECAAKGFAAASEDNLDSPRFLLAESAGMVSTSSQGSFFEPTEPDIFFQGDFDSSGRHLNYVTFGCDSVLAKDQRRKDQKDILTGLQTRDFIYGQRDLRVRLYGMRPRFPVIRGQTTQVVVHSGDRATLFGHVDAIYQPSFQWYRGPSGNLTGLISPIDAATGYAAGKDHTGTNSMLITAPLTGSTNFWFQVSNIYGSTNSQTIQVVVSSAPDAGKPVVDGATINLEIEKGKTLQLSPPITGSYPLSFQWLLNGVVINDATNPILQITNISTLLAGTYAVVASNAYGTITGQVAVVSVTEAVSAPVITSFSTNQTVAPGTDVTLSVNVSGNPLFYLWKKDGEILTGATNSILHLTSVTAQDAGGYQVIVYNDLGSGASSTIYLAIETKPDIVLQPMSQTNSTGTAASFNVLAAGTKPFFYRWRKNGIELSNVGNISGATSTTLTVNNVQSADAGNYDVVVTNNYGAVTSAVVVLTVLTNLEVSGWSALGSGTDDSVWSLAGSDTNLYAGAWFTMAGGVSVNRIAKWNGSSWSALGTGMDNGVIALAVSETNLYAGGSFETAGDVVVNYVAKWNGSSWSALGSGTDGNVSALAVSGTNLYVGGDFTIAGGGSANCIARWNGSSWSTLGSGMNGQVWALAVIGTNLYAAGLFTTAGGVAVNHVAKWNGSSWSALGSGVNDWVNALAVVGTNLYAGGEFTTAGGALANYIARWNGSSWSPLGSGLDASVYVLEASGSNLYAGGMFSMAGGVPANNIAKWGLMSSAPPAITSQPQSQTNAVGTVATFTVGATGTSPLVYQWRKDGLDLSNTGNITGATSTNLTIANVQAADAGNYQVVVTDSYGAVTSAVVVLTVLTNLESSGWSALGSGMSDYVLALAVSGTNLYAGGGGMAPNNIAKWNGSSWSALGSGVNGGVHALAVSGTNLYVGGSFNTAGVTAATNIAKWNGSSWSALGSGMNGPVWALAVSGTNVYAAGDFTTAGGVSANRIAKWNGSDWTALGSGMDNQVRALTVDVSGNLYAGGFFTTAGGAVANRIAKWDGSSWSTLGSGMNSNFIVYALTVDGSDNLYAGGSFTTAGGTAANRIAKWNGSSWSSLGSGMDYMVTALTVDGSGNLYAGGQFTTAGGVLANRIAKWNGSNWTALGSGMDTEVRALTVDVSGNLYAGGFFTTAGGILTKYIARWPQSSAIMPSIALQPQSLTNVAGTTASFSVTATGTAPLSYQWRSNSVPLAGATASSYSITNVQVAHAANYDVIVTNHYGAVTSAVAILTVTFSPTPRITSVTRTNGAFNLEVTGAANSTWWVLRSPSLLGPWTAIGTVVLSANGIGFFVDTNPPPLMAFYRLSDMAPQPLFITQQPTSQSTSVGATATFSVAVYGAPPLHYQWRKNGGYLVNETNSSLALSNVQSGDAGDYNVVVTNNYGSVTSIVATLTVREILKISNIVATATSELTAYNRLASHSVDGVKLDGNFWESSGVGFLYSSVDDRAPAITFDLQGIYRLDHFLIWNSHELAPGIKTMQVKFSSAGTNFSNFDQLQMVPGTGSEVPSGSNTLNHIETRFVRFDILGNQDGQVFPFSGAATHNAFVAIDEVEFYGEFLAPVVPRILQQPQSVSNCLVGISVGLGVKADGTPPLAYQWRHNGTNLMDTVNLTGSTNSSLVLTSFQPSDAGQYDVVVTNTSGSVTSQVATLKVGTNSLLAWLPFDSDAHDASGNNRDGIVQGAILTTNRFGVLESAYSFNGGNNIAVNNLDPDIYTNGFSFGAWVRPDTYSGVLGWTYDGGWGATYFVAGGSTLDFRVGTGNPATAHSVAANAPVGAWSHVFITHSPTNDSLYLNGVIVGQWPSYPMQGNVSTLLIGSSYGGGNFVGAVDDVVVYGRELSVEEVTNLFNGGLMSQTGGISTVLANPTIAGGAFSFNLVAPSGTPFDIQSSTNLTEWTTIRTVTIPSTGTTNIIEGITPGAVQEFYRVHQ